MRCYFVSILLLFKEVCIMSFIEEQLALFKKMIEDAIRIGGTEGKNACIKSQEPINLIHEAVKEELVKYGIIKKNIHPPLGQSSPEMKIAGFLKQKNQDVCVTPNKIKAQETDIDWGLMAYQSITDLYGYEYSLNTLVINVRSQMSSVAKNTDTLFERTFAEALNLHLRYPQMVLGEVYLIPAYEYDDNAANNNEVAFKERHINVEKYITFFDAINNRINDEDNYKYERCALLIVDFRQEKPKLYKNSDELKQDGIISRDFPIEYASLAFDSFIEEILDVYAFRFEIGNIQDPQKISKRLVSYKKNKKVL